MADLFSHRPVKPKNPEQALALALILAINAPDEQSAAECVQAADEIASDLHPAEVQSIRDVVEICMNVL